MTQAAIVQLSWCWRLATQRRRQVQRLQVSPNLSGFRFGLILMIVSRSFSLGVSSTLSHTSSIVNISSAQHVSWLSLFLEQLRVMSHFRPSTILPTFFRFRNSYLDSISDSESFRFKFQCFNWTNLSKIKHLVKRRGIAFLKSLPRFRMLCATCLPASRSVVRGWVIWRPFQ